jgi:hypothetical protein
MDQILQDIKQINKQTIGYNSDLTKLKQYKEILNLCIKSININLTFSQNIIISDICNQTIIGVSRINNKYRY